MGHLVLRLFATVLIISQVQSQCPPNYVEKPGSGYCYGLFENDAQIGTDADAKCEDHVASYPGKGHIASILDRTTWDWIKTTFSTRMAGIANGIWFGLYATGNDTFAWRDKRQFCVWTANNATTCNPWVGFPNGTNQRPWQESCVSLRQRVWNETDCSGTFQYYCHAAKPPDAACSTVPSGEAFEYPPGNCFRKVDTIPDNKNFTEASKYCVTLGYQYLWPARDKANTDVITGAWSNHLTFNTWIGLRSDGSGNYYWMDKPNEIGLRHNTFWSAGEPNGGPTSQQCVYMKKGDNWKSADGDCSQAMPYICQYGIVKIERGNAHLSPNDASCESPAKNLLNTLNKTKVLSDGNSATFVKPFSATGTTKYRILVELFEMWRTNPVVTLKGSNLHCLPADGISVVLLLDSRKVNCYLYLPDGTPVPSGPTNKCSYWCDDVVGVVNYISISFKKVLSQLEISEVGILDARA